MTTSGSQFFHPLGNVRSVKKDTKCSSVLLQRLVSFFTELWEVNEVNLESKLWCLQFSQKRSKKSLSSVLSKEKMLRIVIFP